MATEKESVVAMLRTKFFLRGKQGVESLWGPPSHPSQTTHKIERDEAFGSPPADIIEFSSDGSKIVLVNSQAGFVVRDTETSEQILEVENPGIQAIAWSPLGSHLLSWQRPQKDSELGNLVVWNVASGAAVARFNQKIFSKDAWPSVQWSADETICARQSANGVQLYNGRDLTAGTAGQIVLPNTTSFSLAPGPPPYKIALFVPEKKGKPASVRIYQFPGLETVVASKSFYKAQDVTMKWSPTGSALVIETRTDVDTTGKSYYGESGLFFMQSDGQYDCIVPLTKEGQVHDVQWDPTGRGFIVLAGAMPCNATLYDNKAIPIFEFGAAPRNHVSWSPHGRFLCIAGFGNLRGDMDFWDRNKLKKIGSANSNSATCFTWSADSRYFLTATTFPRLRVDNGFKIFKYDGTGPIHQEDRGELYDLKFRPALPDVYPNRPQSPRKKGEEAAAAAPAAPPKVQAYRPPRSSGALAALMRQEETGSKKLDRNKYAPPRAAAAPVGATPGGNPGFTAPRTIPGMSAPAAATKPSKSQRKKKNKEVEEAKAAVEAALGITKTAPATPEAAAPPPTPVVLTEEEKQKKIKAINKKLKQIDELKAKQAGGATLNEDQQQKIANEAALRKEIEELS